MEISNKVTVRTGLNEDVTWTLHDNLASLGLRQIADPLFAE